MSIIISWLSKIALSKVIKYFKENKIEFLLSIIISICFIVILVMYFRLQKSEAIIDNLESEITNLSISNNLLNDDILKLSNDMIINKSFSNSLIKIIYRTNDIYYTNADDITSKFDMRNNFYNLFISNKLRTGDVDK